MNGETRTLNDGQQIPSIGLGTYGLLGQQATDAVASAIGSGYRLIDTAVVYENEVEVGNGLRASGLAREELFVTTKLPGRYHGYEKTLEGFEASCTALGLDYLDLYLIHWPLPMLDAYVGSWKAMIELRDRGLVRSIGVSNFTEEYLTRLIEETGVTPAVNQIELHPHYPQAELRAFHAARGIQTQSWSPLAQQKALVEDAAITEIAAAHGVTPAQAVLRWHIQLGTIPIPKSGDPQRQRENLDVLGFTLDAGEMTRISGLESGRLWGADPTTHEEY